MPRLYCICLVLVALVPGGRAATFGSGIPAPGTVRPYGQSGPADAGYARALQTTGASPAVGYTIFMRGAPVGREDVTVRTSAAGTTVTSQGRLSAPFNSITRQAEFTYGPGWAPESFSLDATVNGAPVTLRTTFAGGTATSQGTQGGAPITASHAVAARTIVLPNGIFSAYAALALRLASAPPETELRAYVLPLVEIGVRVDAAHSEQMQLGNRILNVRRYDLVFANPGGDLALSLTADDNGSLLRLHVAAQGLDVVREDVAASTARTQVFSNPGDEPVTIPVSGFNIGATLTRPKAGPARLPAVVLLSGAGVDDRDGFALGVPVFGQLAGAIADAGMLAVRYDKRGYGQSGGRAESATVSDYAEDARSIVRWLEKRKDVDPKRIALLGHSEGAWIALLTAAREKRVAAVVSVAGPSSTGAELNLEQQQLALERSTLAPADRESRIALQKQIQSAVLTGKGWEGVPPELRRQADTPWFQSFLGYSPGRVLEDVRQPLLFVHGALDRQVPVEHVERLSDIARKGSDSKSVEVVVVRGVNHLLVPAFTGDLAEYATLTDRNVSGDVSMAITGWLTKTFAAIR